MTAFKDLRDTQFSDNVNDIRNVCQSHENDFKEIKVTTRHDAVFINFIHKNGHRSGCSVLNRMLVNMTTVQTCDWVKREIKDRAKWKGSTP